MPNPFRTYIQAFLDSLGPGLVDNIRDGDIGLLYEAYIYFILAEALRRNQYVITTQNLQGNTFRFRRRPGPLSPNITYLSVEKPIGMEVAQLHKGVEVVGKSGEVHELDIALTRSPPLGLYHDGNPRLQDLRMYFECKNHTKPLKKSVAREYMGLVKEMTNAVPNGVVTNVGMQSPNWSIRIILERHHYKVKGVNDSHDSVQVFTGWVQSEIDSRL